MTVPSNPPSFIYKVLPRQEHATALSDGVYTGSPVDHRDGFIHFSTAAQLGETLRRHYAGQRDLLILVVPVSALDDLRWEPSRGGDLFPHLYKPLPLSTIAGMAAIDVGADGSFELPDMVR